MSRTLMVISVTVIKTEVILNEIFKFICSFLLLFAFDNAIVQWGNFGYKYNAKCKEEELKLEQLVQDFIT